MATIVKPGGDHTDPLAQKYGLYLFRRLDTSVEVITSAGPRSFAEGEPPPASLHVPVEFWSPLVEAIYQADDRPMPTDAATLSKALDVERARVNDVMQHFMGRDG
jgi:hypothetical protein